MLTCCDQIACSEWISGVPWIAPTVWIVVLDRAESISTTNPRTGVFAFILNTCPVIWALGIDCAFRLAFNVRIPL